MKYDYFSDAECLVCASYGESEFMTVIITYRVDKDSFYAPETKHNISLTTTEYTYRNDTLVHLQVGRNLGIRLNNMMRYEFKKELDFQNDQFLFKKSYSQSKAKTTTRGTFEEKLKRFDMSQTVVEQEIVVEYAYIDESDRPDEVQIVISIKSDTMIAAIDFKDVEQYQRFICPAWLLESFQ